MNMDVGRFSPEIGQVSQLLVHLSALLLRFGFSAEVETVQSNIGTLIKEGLGPRTENDFLLARDTCVAFSKLSTKVRLICTIFRPQRDI